MSEPSSDPPQSTLGRYVLERRIASGGMADVFLARFVGAYGFVKRVALKVLKREIAGDDENVRMFIREAVVSAEFRHTNLAQVYEVGETHGRLFIAMELVRGVSVAAMLKGLADRHKGMPLNVAVRIAIDTLDGLGHAHEATGTDGRPLGLVHRDVSPQNIMVAVDGAVKVVDFGIARVESRGGMASTQSPKIKGKFSYMAPEQWEPRAPLDARADLFALGIVLYEMTTGGARLFRGETPKDIYKAVVIETVPDPRTRVPDYPDGLARIVMRALERGPNARWPSARAMRTALVEWAQGENWSLSSRAVADTLRAALGSTDVEARWELVSENAQAMGLLPDEPTAPDRGGMVAASRTPTAETVPGHGRRAELPTEPPRPGTVGGAGAVMLTGAALGLVVSGAIGGVIGRRIERGAADARVERAVAQAREAAAVRVPVALRVRGYAGLASGAAAQQLAARFHDAHPEATVAFAAAGSGDAIGAVVSGNADVALVLRGPDAGELAAAVAQGASLGPETRVTVGRAIAMLVVNAANPVASVSLAQARALFHAPPSDWTALGAPTAGSLRVIARAPADELFARVDSTLLQGAAIPSSIETAPSAEAAQRLVEGDPHAVTVLALGGFDPAASRGVLRAVPIAPAQAADAPDSPLAYPLVAVTRGAPRREVRSLLDWLRASDLDPLLRAQGVVR